MKRKNVKCVDCVITAGLNVRHSFIIYELRFYLPTAGMKINEALSHTNYRTANNKLISQTNSVLLLIQQVLFWSRAGCKKNTPTRAVLWSEAKVRPAPRLRCRLSSFRTDNSRRRAS